MTAISNNMHKILAQREWCTGSKSKARMLAGKLLEASLHAKAPFLQAQYNEWEKLTQQWTANYDGPMKVWFGFALQNRQGGNPTVLAEQAFSAHFPSFNAKSYCSAYEQDAASVAEIQGYLYLTRLDSAGKAIMRLDSVTIVPEDGGKATITKNDSPDLLGEVWSVLGNAGIDVNGSVPQNPATPSSK